MFRFVYCSVLNVNNHFPCTIELSTRDLIGRCSDSLVVFFFFIIIIRTDPMFAFRVCFLCLLGLAWGLLGVSFGSTWGFAWGHLSVRLSWPKADPKQTQIADSGVWLGSASCKVVKFVFSQSLVKLLHWYLLNLHIHILRKEHPVSRGPMWEWPVWFCSHGNGA